MAVIKRPVVEEGIVLYKYHKAKTNEFKSSSGEIIKARPENWVVVVASSYEFDKINGLREPNMLSYSLWDENEETLEKAKAMFERLKFGDKVMVKYQLAQGNVAPKPEEIMSITGSVINNNNNGGKN